MIELVIEARRRDLGGFTVGRVLPFGPRRMVGPFIFFDHIGPLTLPPNIPREADVRSHPHIGLATITYLFAGEITHRDSTGVEQVIRAGEVNWMTAGRGITHSERFEGMREHGGPMHGLQTWVALPEHDEETAPGFAHHDAGELPLYEEHGIKARLVAGSAFGAESPVRVSSPLFYVHTDLTEGAVTSVPDGYSERAAFVASGTVEVDGRRFHAGQMLVFTANTAPVLRAVEPTTLVMIGGEPVGPRHIWWNFVSSRRERIAQAAEEWRAGKFKLPPTDDKEFIPLPEEPMPPPEPMS
jgi:redox-sensitive bicupin YhaK (pirin superfamily)